MRSKLPALMRMGAKPVALGQIFMPRAGLSGALSQRKRVERSQVELPPTMNFAFESQLKLQPGEAVTVNLHDYGLLTAEVFTKMNAEVRM